MPFLQTKAKGRSVPAIAAAYEQVIKAYGVTRLDRVGRLLDCSTPLAAKARWCINPRRPASSQRCMVQLISPRRTSCA